MQHADTGPPQYPSLAVAVRVVGRFGAVRGGSVGGWIVIREWGVGMSRDPGVGYRLGFIALGRRCAWPDCPVGPVVERRCRVASVGAGDTCRGRPGGFGIPNWRLMHTLQRPEGPADRRRHGAGRRLDASSRRGRSRPGSDSRAELAWTTGLFQCVGSGSMLRSISGCRYRSRRRRGGRPARDRGRTTRRGKRQRGSHDRRRVSGSPEREHAHRDRGRGRAPRRRRVRRCEVLLDEADWRQLSAAMAALVCKYGSVSWPGVMMGSGSCSKPNSSHCRRDGRSTKGQKGNAPSEGIFG